MLCSLNIRDLAVVQILDLDFHDGLTVLTGETGAGKSILLTALGLALGNRADPGYIRSGCKKAEINLEFDINDASEAKQWLTKNELEEGRNCLIRRVLSDDGRSRAFVNNRPVTLQSLQELGSSLIEIHGQHAHLKLLQSVQQRQLLDELSENNLILEELRQLHSQWRSAKTDLDDRLQKAENRNMKEDLLDHQIAELERSGIESQNYVELLKEHICQANLGKILSLGQHQLQQLYEDEQHSVNVMLEQSINAMDDLGELSSEFNEVSVMLGEALIQVQESTQIIRRRLDALESDPKRLEWLEDWLGVIHGLAKKHQTTPEDLLQILSGLREEKHCLQTGTEQITELVKEIASLETNYKRLAHKLSRRRNHGAQIFQKKISKIIKELGMPQGEFIIGVSSLNEGVLKPDGFDKVEFRVSSNPGLTPKAIGKIASGGELSRISLAIQVVAMNAKITPTMIFDEVDSGIGGAVAEIVGQRLRSLGKRKQVFCVTHLAQVAAQAQQHLLVEKSSKKSTTHSRVRLLSSEERRHEIARMIGGVNITEQTLAHASEMLTLSESI